MAGSMTGMSEEEYRDMMIARRPLVEGNRVVGERRRRAGARQPQGSWPGAKRGSC